MSDLISWILSWHLVLVGTDIRCLGRTVDICRLFLDVARRRRKRRSRRSLRQHCRGLEGTFFFRYRVLQKQLPSIEILSRQSPQEVTSEGVQLDLEHTYSVFQKYRAFSPVSAAPIPLSLAKFVFQCV